MILRARVVYFYLPGGSHAPQRRMMCPKRVTGDAHAPCSVCVCGKTSPTLSPLDGESFDMRCRLITVSKESATGQASASIICDFQSSIQGCAKESETILQAGNRCQPRVANAPGPSRVAGGIGRQLEDSGFAFSEAGNGDEHAGWTFCACDGAEREGGEEGGEGGNAHLDGW
jgi:hypothetical protein